MRPSRGMGCINPEKQPRTIKKRDGNEPVKLFKEGGEVGLYANIHAKRKRIAEGSGEKMRPAGKPGAPTAQAFKRSALTAKGK
jgi:hypothetical protein